MLPRLTGRSQPSPCSDPRRRAQRGRRRTASRRTAPRPKTRCARKYGLAAAGMTSCTAPPAAAAPGPAWRCSPSMSDGAERLLPHARQRHIPAQARARPPAGSRSKPLNSSITEKSVGSWSSTAKTPSPMAWGVPAGTSTASPGSTSNLCSPAASPPRPARRPSATVRPPRRRVTSRCRRRARPLWCPAQPRTRSCRGENPGGGRQTSGLGARGRAAVDRRPAI